MKLKIRSAETTAAVREFTERFSPTRHGAQLARHATLRQLDCWGLRMDDDLPQSAALVVAELAANAVLHGRVPGRQFEVRLVLHQALLRIEVSDARSERRPGPACLPRPDDEYGRGLLLVDCISLCWGVLDRYPIGKTVWAELAVPAWS
ncbi:ATP-binding protein [Streptomyces sp. NPDC092296]|uniref:ATP-binding protein n=1 Tax=Streptomyces sp. NPDC092296 TaxID=3366012 RepID=UPI00382523B8